MYIKMNNFNICLYFQVAFFNVLCPSLCILYTKVLPQYSTSCTLYDYLVIRKRFLLYTVYIILSLSLILTLYCGLQGYFLFVQYCRFTHFPYLFRHRKSSFWHALHLGSDSNLQAWHDVCWHGLWQLRDTSATLLQSKESIYILFIYMYTSQWHEDRYSG